MPPENDKNRLDKIESELGQIKAIMLAILILLIVGMFVPQGLLALVGISIAVAVLIAIAIYVGLRVLDSLLKSKLQDGEREREQELLQEIQSLNENHDKQSANGGANDLRD